MNNNLVIDIHEFDGCVSSFESIASAVRFMSDIGYANISAMYSNDDTASKRLCEEYAVLRESFFQEVKHV
jgi:hypothetical protein